MKRSAARTAGLLLIATAVLAAGLAWVSDPFTARARPKAPAPERLHAVIKGTSAADVRFTGDLKRVGRTRWCGHLGIDVRLQDSGDLQAEQRHDSGRECGTILRESVVMLTVACPGPSAPAGCCAAGRGCRSRDQTARCARWRFAGFATSTTARSSRSC